MLNSIKIKILHIHLIIFLYLNRLVFCQMQKIKIDGYETQVILHNNTLFPSFATNLLEIKYFKPRPDDTFIIGYPKSGTTWTEEIAWLIQNNLDYEKAISIFHHERVVFLDKDPFSKSQAAIDSPRIFKSHLLLDYLPDNIEKISNVIYIMRNPKDILVSFYNFIKSIKNVGFSGDFEMIVDYFMTNKMIYGDWRTHVNEYFANPHVLFISYEDLLEVNFISNVIRIFFLIFKFQNSFETIKKIAIYLGKNYSNEALSELVEFTSFRNMKQSPSFNVVNQDPQGSQLKTDFNKFFRSGQIGNWINYFTYEMSNKVDQFLRDKINPNIQLRYFPTLTTNH